MDRFAAVARELTLQSGLRCAAAPERRLGGASASECYAWPCASGMLFVKLAARSARAVLEAEAAGLLELGKAGVVRVPRVRASGDTEAAAFLALEWIEAGRADEACERRLGEGLAALHAVTAPRYGWLRDNTIGPTAQANGWCDDWLEFFRERRLRPQLQLAAHNGFAALVATPGEQLLAALPRLLGGHAPRASLLHGDLWGGNWLATAEGEPVIFDPAVYYGDRETDLAMTRLFGGFGAAFYRAYEAAAPREPGAQLRGELYNLYHVLNHANLFGGGYARQARAMMERLLAHGKG
jgi:protein-ribulosamine 3-kinase